MLCRHRLSCGQYSSCRRASRRTRKCPCASLRRGGAGRRRRSTSLTMPRMWSSASVTGTALTDFCNRIRATSRILVSGITVTTGVVITCRASMSRPSPVRRSNLSAPTSRHIDQVKWDVLVFPPIWSNSKAAIFFSASHAELSPYKQGKYREFSPILRFSPLPNDPMPRKSCDQDGNWRVICWTHRRQDIPP